MKALFRNRKGILLVLLVISFVAIPLILLAFCDLDYEIRRLQSPVAELRLDASRNILECLTKGDNYYVEPLIDILENESNDKIVSNIICSLGRIGDEKACETVVKFAENKNAIIRNSVAQALGQLNCGSGCEVLIQLLDDKIQLVRGHAAYSLVLFGDNCKKELRKLLKNSKATTNQRSYACIILGDLGDLNSFYPLITIAAKTEPKWLSNSAKEGLMRLISQALKQNKYSKLRDKLLKYLDFNKDEIVRVAIVMLGNLGEEEALSKLEKIKGDTEYSEDIRAMAENAIEKINRTLKEGKQK